MFRLAIYIKVPLQQSDMQERSLHRTSIFHSPDQMILTFLRGILNFLNVMTSLGRYHARLKIQLREF